MSHIDDMEHDTVTVSLNSQEAAALATAILHEVERFHCAPALTTEEQEAWQALHGLAVRLVPQFQRKVTLHRRMRRAALN